jgi:hypothetical protein
LFLQYQKEASQFGTTTTLSKYFEWPSDDEEEDEEEAAVA